MAFPFFGGGAPRVAVLRLFGTIGTSTTGRGLSLATLARDLETAFRMRGAKAVALCINSPGGSPVQSNLIYARIRALATETKMPVYAFVEDAAASGGYWLACAADEIFADGNSVVGSIGVISAGFGFPGLLAKLGVERRLYAAGEHKGMLDAFSPERQDDIARLLELQKTVHQSFIDLVRGRRGAKLKADDAKLFSGEFWSGSQGLGLGLVDGLGDLRTILRQRFGDKVRLKVVGKRAGGLRMLLGRTAIEAPDLSALSEWPDRLLGALEARALWARFGL